MIALVVGLCLPLAQDSASVLRAPESVRELVGQSTMIAWVRVEDVLGLEVRESPALRALWPGDEPPFARLTVEELVVGDGSESPSVVFVGDADGGTRLRAGERELLVLGPDLDFRYRLSDDKRPQSRDFVAGCLPRAILPGGLWRLSRDGERFARPPLAPPLGDADANELPRAQLEAALDLALDLELPRFEVELSSNGLQPFHLRLAGDGRLSGVFDGQVEASDLSALWAAVERERFLELPERVGRSDAPCLRGMRLTVVTRRARRTTTIVLGAIAAIPPGDERDATDRALRVWEALPIPDRPILR